MENENMSKLKEKLKLQELEIDFLRKKLDSNFKEDENFYNRIKLEILKDTRTETNKRLLTIIPIAGLILSIFGFLGFENIKNGLLDQIDVESIKEKVLIAANDEMKDIENTKTKVINLENEIKGFLDSTKVYSEEVYTLTKAVEQSKKESELIIKALDPNQKDLIYGELRNRLFDRTYLSTDMAISVLEKETKLDSDRVNYLKLISFIQELQKKYYLTPDGNVGAATSVLIMAIAVHEYKETAINDIRGNKLKRSLNFPNSYFKKEKGINLILSNKNHQLHFPMKTVLKEIYLTD